MQSQMPRIAGSQTSIFPCLYGRQWIILKTTLKPANRWRCIRHLCGYTSSE